MYEKNPKKINRKVFKNTETSPLDSIIDRQNNILTNPEDIASEIYIQQSISNRPTVPTCQYQNTHPLHCTCGVRQYPWHDLDGYIIDKRGEPHTPLHTYFDQETYDFCLKNLSNNKAPGPDKIPNSILKNMPPRFHKLLFLFFKHCYKQKQIPASWKTSLTVLLYKKGNPSQLTNHRPIALANTIYKFYTSTLTSILSTYGEKYQILHDSQEGFRAERSTSRQIQLLIGALEDARLTNQDIYILYIDFKNAFGSIDHARLLAIMKDLGYPTDSINLIGNIYSQSSTIFTGEHFGKTSPIPIQRGTIQGDTLSPYLFIIFLEPLLRWLQQGNNGYTFGTSKVKISSAAYADDLAAIANKLETLQTQLNKLDKFCEWAGMDLGIPKCAITGCPNKSKLHPTTFKALIQSTNINYRNQPIPVLNQHEPYTYLGINLAPSLKWKTQINTTTAKVIKQCQALVTCPATMKQKINMADTVIRAGIAYSFYAVPYSIPAIKKLDKKIIALHKTICGIPKCTSNIATQLPHNLFGIEAFSLQNAYLRCIGEQLQNALNDKGRIGKIYTGLLQFILAKYGGSKEITRIKYHHCVRSPITRTLFLLKHKAGVHLKSTINNFLLTPSSLETAWMQEAQMLHGLNPNTSLKLLHKLLIHNITTLDQITMPNGTTLMNKDEFKIYHSTPSKLIQSALNIANQLFCHPPCNQCPLPCQQHHPPRSLKNKYIIRNHNILPHTPTAPVHPPNLPIPHLPPPPNNMLKDPRQFPIHKILDHKQKQSNDHNGIKRTVTSYLCQWTTTNNNTYNKWRTQRDLYPYCEANICNHNTNLLIHYYTERQHKHFSNIINAYFTTEQHRDTRYVTPTTIIPLAHISISECNPENDIETNSDTIQTQFDVAHIYEDNGQGISSPSRKLD